jgi:hypothetical protein
VTDTQPLRSDRVYGAIALVMVVLAGYFALRGGPADGAPAPVPTLVIVAPAEGSQPAQPLTVVFDAGAPLRAGASGWSADGRHVHARLGTTELMSGIADIQPEGGTRYRWVLPRLPAGDQVIQLFWSDSAHQPLRAGASAPVHVRLP